MGIIWKRNCLYSSYHALYGITRKKTAIGISKQKEGGSATPQTVPKASQSLPQSGK